MSEIVFRFLTGLASPLITLSEKIHKYQEKKETKEQLVNALHGEIRSYEAQFNELMGMGEELSSMIKQIEKTPTPHQVIEILDCLSQAPRITARFIMSFIEMAKACKEISSQRAFMDSLKESSHFLFDFVERMGESYIEKDTVRIDGRFFRFFSTYKEEMLKESWFQAAKVSKMKEKDIKAFENKVKAIARCLNEPFLERHMRNPSIKKWRSSLQYLGKATKSITYEVPSKINLDEFMPFDLQTMAKLLDDHS